LPDRKLLSSAAPSWPTLQRSPFHVVPLTRRPSSPFARGRGTDALRIRAVGSCAPFAGLPRGTVSGGDSPSAGDALLRRAEGQRGAAACRRERAAQAGAAVRAAAPAPGTGAHILDGSRRGPALAGAATGLWRAFQGRARAALRGADSGDSSAPRGHAVARP